MTNEQILQFASSLNYAHLYIDSTCSIRYGRARWEKAVPELSDEQRAKLVQKIEHWRELVKREQVPESEAAS